MPTELKMPALSPTMEEGTLAKWLVKEGDVVKSGDLLAEIEPDKATMEFEAVDEGTISKILVAEGTDGVKVGAPIAILTAEGEEASPSPPAGEGGAALAAGGEGVAAGVEGAAGVSPPPFAGGAGFGASAFAAVPSPSAAFAAPPSPAGGEGLASSPSAVKIAIGAPTFTPSVPSATRIFEMVPSSTASNSIVALSVSISAKRSPDLTTSPSLTSHLASVPSSIVGESAGIFSSVGMAFFRGLGLAGTNAKAAVRVKRALN